MAREMTGDQRLEAVQLIAVGLIDAVRERDALWVEQVCRAAESRAIDTSALLVALAARAVESDG